MNGPTRRWVMGLAIATSLIGSAALAQGVDSMTIVVPSSPGGGFDLTARAMQEALQAGDAVGTVTVENHPGGGGAIALGQVIDHEGDPGRTMIGGLALVSAGLATDAPYTMRDLTPVARLTSEWQALAVAPDSEFETFADLRAALEADPGSVAFAGGAAGSLDHVTVGLLFQALGLDPTQMNYVAHSGGGEVAVAVMGGHLPVGVSGVSEFGPTAAAGDLRILAVLSDGPVEGVDAPTLMDDGVDLAVGNWRSIHAAPNLSEDDMGTLLGAVSAMAESAEWEAALDRNGWSPAYLDGDAFAEFLEAEWSRTEETLMAIGLR